MYIDASRPDLTRVAGTEVQDPGATREALPEDLETFLMEDNKVLFLSFRYYYSFLIFNASKQTGNFVQPRLVKYWKEKKKIWF